jgi:sulfite reductase (NADPH) flavoprotein alpha-component
LPESAPFSSSQRAWLNGFIAGLLGSAPAPAASVAAAPAEEQFPWHDASLAMDERLKLADGKPPERVLMAAMAQLDCGACGYVCKTYAEAIAGGAEKDLNKCSPGGKETSAKLKELVKLTVSATPAATAVASAEPSVAPAIEFKSHTREHPFAAPLLVSRRLTGDGSAKDVRHVEFGLKGAKLAYKAGDALGVWPENCLDLVAGILDRLGCSGAEEAKAIDGHPTSLFEALRRERVITQPTEALIELLVDYATDRAEARQLQAMLTEEGGAPLEGLHVLDVLQCIPSSRPPVNYLVDALGTLQPRLYSISSSPKAHRDQVHLTVGTVRYLNRRGRRVTGVASTYLADRVRLGEKVRVFVHESKNFAPPANPDAPMIMIGPGTGIAPFRAFLHERRAIAAKGRNWLFFGDQRANCDFLYRDELESFKADGSLHRLDTAFSRDQQHKTYVQHRMKEQSGDIWRWLAEGAHIYVCGDAKRMAADVDRTLREIIATEGNLSADGAKQYVSDLTRDRRYQRDVY